MTRKKAKKSGAVGANSGIVRNWRRIVANRAAAAVRRPVARQRQSDLPELQQAQIVVQRGGSLTGKTLQWQATCTSRKRVLGIDNIEGRLDPALGLWAKMAGLAVASGGKT